MDSRDLEQRRGLKSYNANSRSPFDAFLTLTETKKSESSDLD